jgi:hypothetical protein
LDKIEKLGLFRWIGHWKICVNLSIFFQSAITDYDNRRSACGIAFVLIQNKAKKNERDFRLAGDANG